MWCAVVLLFILVPQIVVVKTFDERQLEKSLKLQLEDYLETGQYSADLENSLEQLQLPHYFRQSPEQYSIASRVACFACRSVVSVVFTAIRANVSQDKLRDLMVKVCAWLKIEAEHVCRGVVGLNAPTVFYIIKNKPSLTSGKVCSILVTDGGCSDANEYEWIVDLPPRIAYKNRKTPKGKVALKVLHITDVHYDPEYAPGASADCVEPLCCQAGSTPRNPGARVSGKWGDYHNCDTPLDALLDSLKHIIDQHKKIDFVYFTGDIVSHKVWGTSIEENKKAIVEVLVWFKRHFADKPVYPILGNHETHPVDLFTSEGVYERNLSTQWIFDLVAEEWQTWLPPKTKETILRGGYYTVLHKPKFRIVALNSNVCYTLNFWLLYDDFDPFGQLQWLALVLEQAEKNGEFVHILSHVPMGSRSCLQNWSKVYISIINRFAHIIAAQFTGHTHYDDTVIYFDPANPSKAINVAFNGGSLTAYSNLNPNYKVYDVDAETLQVLDFESWTYNVTRANLSPDNSPSWYKLYSFKDAYGVSELSPQQLYFLTQRIARNRTLSAKYFRYRHRESDTTLNKGCDAECHKGNLCGMVTTNPENNHHCELLTDLYTSAKPLSVL